MNSEFRRRRYLVGLLGVLLVGLMLRAGPALADSSVPYNDPLVVGSIGLCNAAGQTVTTGSVNDVPFVTKAIDSTPAAAPYNGAGETATLFLYQPRQNIAPDEWHGEQIGASSRSSTPQHPTAILTAGDGPLAAVLADYPPTWDGLMQLRIYLGAPNQPTFRSTYDATDIKITGNTWQVVRGASVACGNGQSVSLEQVLASAYPQLTSSASPSVGAAGATAPAKGGTSAGATAKAGAGAATAGASGAPGTSGSAGAAPGAAGSAPGSADASSNPSGIANAASTGSSGSGGGPGAVVWILIVVGVIGIGAASVLWQRSKPVGTRRR
jgi:hypothetical protein